MTPPYFTVNRFPNKLASKVPNKIPENPPFCLFASYLIVSLTPFINKPDSSRDLIIFMISFISSLEIIYVVVQDPDIFLWIAVSVADAAAVNPNGIKTLSANDLSKCLIKGNPVFSNGPKNLPKNPPYCPILCNWVFDNLILAEKLLAKALQSLESCVLVNNNLCGDLFLSLESQTFDETLKVNSVPFSVPNLNLLSCKLENLMFKVLHWVILY